MDTKPIKGTVEALSKKAVLFKSETGEVVWVPFSQIFEDDLADLEVGVVTELNIATWFAEREFS